MGGSNIVVIGGGFGGVSAALTSRSLLDSSHTVTLVDRLRRTYLCGSFPLLMVGERDPNKVSRSLGQLANRGIRFVQDEVENIDVHSKTVRTTSGILEFDYLVIGLGASYDWDAVPGSAHSYSFYDIDNARRLRRKLRGIRNGRIVLAVSGTPYKCPPAPFEAAMVMDWMLQQRGVRKNVEIHIHTPEPTPLPVAGPDAGTRLRNDLAQRDIELYGDSKVREVSRDGRQILFSDGTSKDADLVITIPIHKSPDVVASAGLTGQSGWIPVSQSDLSTTYSYIYAVGDVTTVLMSNGNPMPKAGVFASSGGKTVGTNIAAEINQSELVRFAGIGHCYVSYSGTHAATVSGEFLADEKPRVELSKPSVKIARSKERFERDWRRFRL